MDLKITKDTARKNILLPYQSMAQLMGSIDSLSSQ
jgi:hypothetical protein